MMNDRIVLLKREAGRDAAGQPVESWPVLATIWAHVLFQTGAESMRANTDVSVVKCSIRIRKRADVDASMRVRYQGVVYDIKAPLPDSNNRDFMFLVCESVK